MNATKPFDDVAIRMYREDPALAADMLNACLEDGDTEGFLLALRHVSNNELLVLDGLTEEEALALVRQFEKMGNRQAYLVKRESGAGGS